MEGKILKCALAGIVICIVIGAAVLYCFKEYESITLGCELPTEQPILPILRVEEEGVSNESEARALAVKYFPQFENASFIESGLDAFVLKNEHTIFNEYLEIYESGCLIYTRVNDYIIERVSISEFPQEEALTIAEDFISQHGGLGDFELESVFPIATYKNETLIGIDGYHINYRHSYKDIPISSGRGGDGIRITIRCDGNVTTFFRLVRKVIEEEDKIQMISASQAFDALAVAPIPGFVTITEIDVCYYSIPPWENQEYMNPTWRFKMEGGNYLYVDGVTGEVL